MKQSEYEIINTVEKLFADKKIDLFIGYEKGSLPMRTSPYFLSVEDDVRKLIWNGFCSNNLAVYIPRIMMIKKAKRPSRIGILCKGCDNRSVVGLIKEKQVDRNNLFIVGISCSGIIDRKKIMSELNGQEILDVEEDGDNIVVKLKDQEKSFAKNNYLCEACLNCAYPTPAVYDILIKTETISVQPAIPDPIIKAFNTKPRTERWQLFEREISKCIRCYACRDVCPNCYCKECFAEQTKPKWLGVTNELSDIIFYHIVRIFHQAGRCVDCGACARACPMDINLRLFTRMLVDEVKVRFGYEPGISLKDTSALATFSANDKQEFMTEPPIASSPIEREDKGRS
jgi:formate dehydrogenase subunit beta